jgi:hypothetical protein
MDRAFAEADKAFEMADEAFDEARKRPHVSSSCSTAGDQTFRFTGVTFKQRARLFWRFARMAFAALFTGEATLSLKRK